MKRWPLVATFILFIAVCMSGTYWAMQLFKPPQRQVAADPLPVRRAPGLDAAVLLFGARQNSVAASNFQLKGVIVAGRAAESVAILLEGSKPARAVRLGAELIPGVTVKEVHPHYVLLAEGGLVKRVELQKDVKGQAKMADPSSRTQ